MALCTVEQPRQGAARSPKPDEIGTTYGKGQRTEPVQLFVREGHGELEQCGHRLGAGALEERLDDMLERRAARRVSRHRWDIHVAEPFFFVTHLTLFLEHPQLRAHRRGGRVARQRFEHLGGGPA